MIRFSRTKYAGLLLAGLIAVGSASVVAQGAPVIHVLNGGSGDGSSWAEATGDLAGALAAAPAGSSVWVGPGVFRPVSCNPCTAADQKASFVLPKGVQLLGSFKGTETSPAQRNLTSLSTVLSGALDASHSTQNLVYAQSPDPGNRISGFRFTHARALDKTAGYGYLDDSGALLYVTAPDTDTTTFELRVADCRFDDAVVEGYGAAIFLDASRRRQGEVHVSRSTFADCHAAYGGGAIAAYAAFGGTERSTITDCAFERNTSGAAGGGAVLLDGSNGGSTEGSIKDASFRKNTSSGDGGGLHIFAKAGRATTQVTRVVMTENTGFYGGGVQIDGSYEGYVAPTFTDLSITECKSIETGGALHCGVQVGGTARFQVERGIFNDNVAGEAGGAVFHDGIEAVCKPIYRNSRFERNVATTYGGGIYNQGKRGVCSPTFINCVIAENTAISSGGMYCLGSEGGDASPLILNCAFVNNSAGTGGGLYSNADDEGGNARPVVVNTIFQGNEAGTGATMRNVFGRPIFAYCAFDAPDCEALTSGPGGGHTCGPGLLFGTPDVFADADGGDYRLVVGSDVINAGNDSLLLENSVVSDILNGPRIRGSKPDLGPYEDGNSASSKAFSEHPVSAQLCVGDSVQLRATLADSLSSDKDLTWYKNGRLFATNVPLIFFSGVNPRDEGEYYLEAVIDGVVVRSDVAFVTVARPFYGSVDVRSDAPRDKLCVGASYAFVTEVEPANENYTVTWINSNDTLIGAGRELIYTPTFAAADTLYAQVTYASDCAAVRVASTALPVTKIECSVGVSDARFGEDLRVYPSPSTGRLTVELGGARGPTAGYVVYGATGRAWMRGTITGAGGREIDVSGLPTGLYYITAQSAERNWRGSFVKQ